MDHLCFRVQPFDRDAIVTRLAPLGITVGETVERYGAEGSGPSIYFHDPEGNQIELKGPAGETPQSHETQRSERPRCSKMTPQPEHVLDV
jgi:hypothetical protein